MEAPKSLDWVTERRKCSVAGVFRVLAEVVASDVKSAQPLFRPPYDALEVSEQAHGKLIVIRRHESGTSIVEMGIVFEFDKKEITAKKAEPNAQPFLRGRPALGVEGQCRIEVEGHPTPLEPWQFSRLALEDLFFA